MQDGQGRVHVGEEKLDAFLDHVLGEQSWRRGQCWTTWRTRYAIQSIRDLRGECGLSLRLAEFADDLCSRSLGALLLGNGVVGTRQLSRRTIPTRIDAITFDLATMACIARPLDRRRHGERVGVVRGNSRF